VISISEVPSAFVLSRITHEPRSLLLLKC